MSWLSPRGWALDMSGSVQIPIFISSGVSNQTVLYYFVPTLFSFMKQLSRFSGKHNTMLSYWMREELEHYCLALMKWNFKLHSVDRCVSYCGWGYSKYYWPAIFRNAISKFTVCIRMHNAMCLDGSILVCVCVRERDEERERGRKAGSGGRKCSSQSPQRKPVVIYSISTPSGSTGNHSNEKKKKKKQMQRLQMQGIWNPPSSVISQPFEKTRLWFDKAWIWFVARTCYSILTSNHVFLSTLMIPFSVVQELSYSLSLLQCIHTVHLLQAINIFLIYSEQRRCQDFWAPWKEMIMGS